MAVSEHAGGFDVEVGAAAAEVGEEPPRLVGAEQAAEPGGVAFSVAAGRLAQQRGVAAAGGEQVVPRGEPGRPQATLGGLADARQVAEGVAEHRGALRVRGRGVGAGGRFRTIGPPRPGAKVDSRGPGQEGRGWSCSTTRATTRTSRSAGCRTSNWLDDLVREALERGPPGGRGVPVRGPPARSPITGDWSPGSPPSGTDPGERAPLLALDGALDALREANVDVPTPRTWRLPLDTPFPADLTFPLFVRTAESSLEPRRPHRSGRKPD